MTKHFSKIAVGVSLIGAPLLTLVSTLVSPALKSGDAAQVAVISQHPARYYLFAIFTTAGIMLFVPAILGLMYMTRERAPRLGNIGGSLALFGTVIAAGDGITQLLVWQMGARGLNQAQMAALLHHYDNALGSSLPFTIGGLALVVGILLLSIGLIRSRAVPAWTAVGLFFGMLLNIAGFSSASLGVLDLSSLILVAAMCTIGWQVLHRSDDDWADSRAREVLTAAPAGA